MGVLIRITFGFAALLVGLACGGSETYNGRGVVHEVWVGEKSTLIEHEEIPGLMPAMTMKFDVYDPAVLARLSKGDVIEFELTSERGGFFITDATVVSHSAELAPPFELTDSTGDLVSLAGLAGRAVLLEFIFTRCPGPCPALTSSHVSVQRALSPEVRERVRFVSISIDPERDTPADMGAYGKARGADLSDWSFLTGSPQDVVPVLVAYGVGTLERDGALQHVLGTFLIDGQGRIAKRYLGAAHQPSEIVVDIEQVALQ